MWASERESWLQQLLESCNFSSPRATASAASTKLHFLGGHSKTSFADANDKAPEVSEDANNNANDVGPLVRDDPSVRYLNFTHDAEKPFSGRYHATKKPVDAAVDPTRGAKMNGPPGGPAENSSSKNAAQTWEGPEGKDRKMRCTVERRKKKEVLRRMRTEARPSTYRWHCTELQPPNTSGSRPVETVFVGPPFRHDREVYLRVPLARDTTSSAKNNDQASGGLQTRIRDGGALVVESSVCRDAERRAVQRGCVDVQQEEQTPVGQINSAAEGHEVNTVAEPCLNLSSCPTASLRPALQQAAEESKGRCVVDDLEVEDVSVDPRTLEILDGPRLKPGFLDPAFDQGILREPWESEDLAFETPGTKRKFVVRLGHNPNYLRNSQWLQNFLEGERKANGSQASAAKGLGGQYACSPNTEYQVDTANAGFYPDLPPTPFAPREVSRPVLRHDVLVERGWLDHKDPFLEQGRGGEGVVSAFDAEVRMKSAFLQVAGSAPARGKNFNEVGFADTKDHEAGAAPSGPAVLSQQGTKSANKVTNLVGGSRKRHRGVLHPALASNFYARTSFYLDCSTLPASATVSTSKKTPFDETQQAEEEEKRFQHLAPTAADGILQPINTGREVRKTARESFFGWNVQDEDQEDKKDAYGLNHRPFCAWFRDFFRENKSFTKSERKNFTPQTCQGNRLLLVHENPDMWYRCCLRSSKSGFFSGFFRDSRPYEWSRAVNEANESAVGGPGGADLRPVLDCEHVSATVPLSASESIRASMKKTPDKSMLANIKSYFDNEQETAEKAAAAHAAAVEDAKSVQERLACLETRYPTEAKLRGCGDPLAGTQVPCNFVDGLCVQASKFESFVQEGPSKKQVEPKACVRLGAPGEMRPLYRRGKVQMSRAFTYWFPKADQAKARCGPGSPGLQAFRDAQTALPASADQSSSQRLFPGGPLEPVNFAKRLKLYERWPPETVTQPQEYAAGAYDVVFL
ncbi:unnamed protein product [Amoebophrya sp. A120]|nr:unnamed protein product [Amoebophrya sp. A120]|eukprot:GSA120T00025891001.1